MRSDQEKVATELKRRIRRCQELEWQFPDGITNVNIRELEAELREQLDELNRDNRTVTAGSTSAGRTGAI